MNFLEWVRAYWHVAGIKFIKDLSRWLSPFLSVGYWQTRHANKAGQYREGILQGIQQHKQQQRQVNVA